MRPAVNTPIIPPAVGTVAGTFGRGANIQLPVPATATSVEPQALHKAGASLQDRQEETKAMDDAAACVSVITSASKISEEERRARRSNRFEQSARAQKRPLPSDNFPPSKKTSNQAEKEADGDEK